MGSVHTGENMPVIPPDYYKITPLQEIESGDASPALLSLYKDFKAIDRNSPLFVFDFSQFMLAAQMGFHHIYYEAHNIPLGDGMGIFWINEEHAINIARVLNSDIHSLELRLSCEEDNALIKLSENIAADTTLKQLTIKHMTYDEVTQPEIRGLARIIHHLNTRKFALYSADFQSGIFDAFVSELDTLNNKSLKAISIFDVTRPEGENEVSIYVLERWLEQA